MEEDDPDSPKRRNAKRALKDRVRGQFVIGAQALSGTPYDGHTLASQIYQVARLTGVNVKWAYVDRGYHGHKIQREGLDITLSQTRGVKSPTIRHEMRRHSDIEHVGATYHSAASARDQGSLRQEALDRLGWAIIRVWSTD